MKRLRIKFTFKKVIELRKKFKLPKQGLSKAVSKELNENITENQLSTKASQSQTSSTQTKTTKKNSVVTASAMPKTQLTQEEQELREARLAQMRRRRRETMQIRKECATAEEAEMRIKELRKQRNKEYRQNKKQVLQRENSSKFSLSSFPNESFEKPTELVRITSSQTTNAKSPEKLDLEEIEKVSLKRKASWEIFADEVIDLRNKASRLDHSQYDEAEAELIEILNELCADKEETNFVNEMIGDKLPRRQALMSIENIPSDNNHFQKEFDQRQRGSSFSHHEL